MRDWRVKFTVACLLFFLFTVYYMYTHMTKVQEYPVIQRDVPAFRSPYVDFEGTVPETAPKTTIAPTSTTIVPETTTTTAPVQPAHSHSRAPDTTISAPVKVSEGSLHRCWVEDAKPVCEGREYHGELGKDVVLPPIVDVQAGLSRTCALTVHGEVYCWGWMMANRTGGGRIEDSHEPVKVNLPGKVLKLAVGVGDECAVVANEGKEQIWCWGFSYSKEHGFALPYFATPEEPVLMWEGRHVHELKVTYKYVQAHVGFSDGGCGWVHWGQPGEHFWDPIINRPERM